jgi:PAS domain S-box-containing protein
VTIAAIPMRDRQRQIQELIETLSAADEALQALGAGEVDAVLSPTSTTPILLSRAQRALAESEARYRGLIARCPALVCEVTPDGIIAFANAAVKSLLGFEPDELVGKSWWDKLVPRDHIDDVRQLATLLRRGDVTAYELPVIGAGRNIKWILWTTANHYDSDGRLVMIIAFGIDITERKRAEDAERELAEAQIARTQAEAANKAKTDFLAVMSHELRTPLNSIGGYAELIEMGLRGPVTDGQHQDLKKIRRSQRHLLGLINDLMNFAKLETGHVELTFQDVAVNEILAVLDALTEPQVAAKNISYHHGRCDPALTVWADREKTHQILINLVSNAVKFTRPGGSITIDCDATDDHVHFHVSDTGQGIAEDKLASIFEPFVQVKTGFTREHEGVGLGLAISRDLARVMRGDLQVESTPDVGSRFTLTLPRDSTVRRGNDGAATPKPTR